jgi:hypothetical protein
MNWDQTYQISGQEEEVHSGGATCQRRAQRRGTRWGRRFVVGNEGVDGSRARMVRWPGKFYVADDRANASAVSRWRDGRGRWRGRPMEE